MAIRNRIRDWRLRRKLTLEQLGDMAGMSAGNLSRLERGEILYTQATLENLATALGCEAAELLGAEIDREQKTLIEIFGTLSPDDRDRILVIATALAERARRRDQDGASEPSRRGE